MLTFIVEAPKNSGIADRFAEQGIDAQVIEGKGVAELTTLLVAFGGGAGIAAIIEQIAAIMRSYFEGKAALETARRIKIAVGNVIIEVASDNVDVAMLSLKQALSKS